MKARTLNLNLILQNALHMRPGVNIKGGSDVQDFQLENRLDNQLIEKSKGVIDGTEKSVDITMKINNECRAFGSTLSYHISMKYAEDGLPDGHKININLKGSAGQSFCAFLAKGVTCTLEGDANDYVGKYQKYAILCEDFLCLFSSRQGFIWRYSCYLPTENFTL